MCTPKYFILFVCFSSLPSRDISIAAVFMQSLKWLERCIKERDRPDRELESYRFEDEDEDEDEDEALSSCHNEIFKFFRLQLGRDDEVDCNNIFTPSLSRI